LLFSSQGEEEGSEEAGSVRAGRGIGNHLLQNSEGNQKLARSHVSDLITFPHGWACLSQNLQVSILSLNAQSQQYHVFLSLAQQGFA